MKNSLKYLILWQKKRNEMSVTDDQQSDWLHMHALLDEHMPVVGSDEGGGSSFFKGLKLLPTLFIAVSAAAMIFTAYYITKTQKQKHLLARHYKIHKGRWGKDTLLYTDSLNTTDNTTGIRQHDSDAAKQTAVARKSDAGMPGSNRTTINSLPGANKSNEDSSTSIKKTNQSVAGGMATGLPATTSQHLGANIRVIDPLKDSKPSRPARAFVSGRTRNGSLAGSNPHHAPSGNDGIANNNKVDAGSKLSSSTATRINDPSLIGLSPPKWNFDIRSAPALLVPVKQNNMTKNPAVSVPNGSKKEKQSTPKGTSVKSSGFPGMDWGILIGANTQGNPNIPADLYYGAYATYNISKKVALNLQLHLSSAQGVSGNYTHANGSKVDTGQKTFLITDSRKLYSMEVPLYIEYRATKHIGIKAGPVFSIPLRQANGKNTLLPDSIQTDSAYYPGIKGQLSKTKFQQKLNYGISGGVSLHFNRINFDATYLHRLNAQKIISDAGSYNVKNNNTFQFTVGFNLNKTKH